MACLIFDFDGTLADTNEAIIETSQATLDKMGLPRIPKEKLTKLIGLPLKENFTLGGGLSNEEADRAVIIYRELFDGIAEKSVTLFPGVADVIKTLSERGVPMAVASSRSQRSLEHLVKFLGLSPYLKNLYGADFAKNPKPAPDLVEYILDQMDMDPAHALVIGDTTYDIEMGNAAGCYTCAVTYGNQTMEQLRTANPDYVIDDLRKIL